MSTWEQGEQLARDIAALSERLDALDLTNLFTAMARDFNAMSNAVANLDERMARMEAAGEQHHIRAIFCEEALRTIAGLAANEHHTAGDLTIDLSNILDVARDVLGDNEEV